MNVYSHLRAHLEDRGFSLLDLASETDISYGVLRRLVRGACDPPLEYALRLSLALRLPVEELFSLAEPHGAGLMPEPMAQAS